MKLKSFFVTFLISILFLALSIFTLRFDPEVRDLEDGVYRSLLTSIVEDGDLNIINQMSPDRGVIVSKTYNYPNLHDHGVAALWIPIYLYTKGVSNYSNSDGYFISDNYRVAMVLSNLFYALALIILIYKFVPILFNRKANPIELISILFGTSIYWYSFVHPSSTDLVSGIFPFIYFIQLYRCTNAPRKVEFFLFGLSLTFGIILKVSLLFYVFLPIYFLIKFRSNLKESIIKFLPSLALGVFTILLPYMVNEYLETGVLMYTYSQIVANYYLLYETVLAPAGYLIVNPIYILAFLGLYLAIRKSKSIEEKGLLTLFMLAPVLKVLVESFTYAGNAEYGARHLLTDVFVLLLLFPAFYTNGIKKTLIYIISALCVLQSLFMSFVYMRDISGKFEWGIFYEKDFSAISNQLPKYKYFLSNVLNGLKGDDIGDLILFYPLMLLCSYALYKLAKADLLKSRILLYFIAFFTSSYLVISIFNISSNSKNVKNLQSKNFYDDKVITNGSLMYGLNDNIGNILMHNRYSKLRGDQKYIEITEKALSEYSDKAINEIVVDPIGLKKKIKERDFDFIDF